MVEIVPNEPVNDRRLRAGGFQGGVGVNHAGGGIEAGIGNTTLAHTAIVAGDFFQQELDGVVSVGTFIKVGWPLVGFMGADIQEGAFGHPAAADILVDKDIARFLEKVGWPKLFAIVVNAIR